MMMKMIMKKKNLQQLVAPTECGNSLKWQKKNPLSSFIIQLI